MKDCSNLVDCLLWIVSDYNRATAIFVKLGTLSLCKSFKPNFVGGDIFWWKYNVQAMSFTFIAQLTLINLL